MATVMAAVAVIEAFTEVGLKQSIIQHKKGAEERFINIIWWLSSGRGIILYLIGFLIAPLICDFYQKPEMLPLLRVSFLVVLFNGLISPRVYVLQKELRFKGWVFLMQGSGVLGVVLTLIIAFFFQNVWALVIGYAAEAFIRSSLSFIFYPIKPGLNFDKLLLRDIIAFSKKMFGLPILMLLFVQTDIFVVGKVLTMTELGMYALAKSLAEMPNTFLSKVIQPMILPTLSQMQDSKAKLKESILILTKWTMMLGLPFIAFFVVFAKPILSVVYGSKYISVAGSFGLLSVYSLILLCSSFIMSAFTAMGQPDIHRTASFIRTALFLIIIYPATHLGGLSGAACAVLLVMLIMLGVQIFYVKRFLQIGYLEYCSVCWEGIILSMIVIVPGCVLNILIQPQPLTGFIVGIVLCFISWSFAIIKIVHLHKKGLL